MVKKSKKDKKKSKKKQISPEEEKDLLMTLLATKCNMKKEDVEKSYDEFNLKYKDGFIQKDEYIQSMKVTNVSLIFSLSKLYCPEHHDGRVSVPSVWRGQEWDSQFWGISAGLL